MRRIALALVLAAGVVGCDPFVPRVEDTRTFAVFGTLDGRRAQQRLRVEDLSIPLTETPDRLPATVTSTELGTGATVVWRDSLVTLTDGSRAHLFVADVAVAQGETYRIEAVRDSDGARSSVTVTLPDPIAVADTSDGSGPPSFSTPTRVEPLGGITEETLVRYRVEREDGTGPRDLIYPTPRGQDGSVQFSLSLGSVAVEARTKLYDTAPGMPVLTALQFEAVARSLAPDAVEGGVGTVGWAIPLVAPIDIPAEALVAAGFVDAR